ncbi:MAG: enoyl-CoA hydratase/isomerase family protein [Candidatus Omnitrophica bacterium]|nr:enoyl-CoA hydratase/isomerase family protein [Candidatus Omnitrophota bacterium]
MITFREDNHIGYVEFDDPDAKVNVLGANALARLTQIVSDLGTISNLKAVVFQSRKPGVFIAGADIREIQSINELEDARTKVRVGQDLFDAIEDLKIPTVAFIDGVALGGGCELALACLYRVATFNDKVKIGLPEVNLGVMPGFGGTYRLPRIIGLTESLKLILAGKPVDGRKALRIGLVDKLIPSAGAEAHLLEYIHRIVEKNVKKKRYRPPRSKGMIGVLERFRPLHGLIFKQSRQNVMALTKGRYPAPLKALETIQQNFYVKRPRALELEREAFAELAITDISKNLIHVFFLMEKYKKLKLPGGEDLSADIRHMSVLGAGVMGGGIAQLLASRGIWVRLKDINFEALAQGLRAAVKIFSEAVKKRRITKAEAERRMGQITPTLDYSGFGHTDMVIEAVVENMDIKKSVFQELDGVVGPHTILATNTSALSVTEMASVVKDPSRVVGFHFFNPVHRMPLVEIITTDRTSAATTATALGLAKRLGKTPVVVKDSSGFLVNRILLVYMAEAGRILEETGDPEHIDQVITDFGMPMGPFLLSDEVGLDVGLKVMRILQDSFGDRYRPVKIFDKLLEHKKLGKKTGTGFYRHNRRARSIDPVVIGMLDRSQVHSVADPVIQKRLIYLMINEAARCLEEGVVDEPHAVDVGMIFGTGFPPFRGGLLYYADKIGIGEVVDELIRFQDQYHSDRFAPCEYLKRLKEQQSTFYSTGGVS